MGAAAASIVCFTSLFIVLAAMLALKGQDGLADASLWQSYVLQVVALIMLCSVTVLLSTCSTPMGAVTFSFLILVSMRYGAPSILERIEGMGSVVLREAAWIAYLALPHFDFFNMSQRVVHGWGPLPPSLLIGIVAYGLAYSLFATAFGALIFRRRWL
jgi:hypothetical protein